MPVRPALAPLTKKKNTRSNPNSVPASAKHLAHVLRTPYSSNGLSSEAMIHKANASKTTLKMKKMNGHPIFNKVLIMDLFS